MAVERIDYDKCNDCGICYDVCPMDVFRTVGRNVYIAYHDDCMTCYLCSTYCAKDAVYVGPERPVPVPTCY
ncbi:MAG: ferredoxin family protein [Chloroflexi bacterium]|nr:ferredoxin family protein [Chloroflexota bacterium]